MLTIGITVLFIGSELVTKSSQELSSLFGLPIFLIGIIVAVGTCLPELAFAIRAAEKTDTDIGIGNILGNVLADSMLTIGVIVLINPIKIPNLASPLLAGLFVASSIILVFWHSRDGELGKRDAAMLIAVYAIFITVQYLFEALII